MRPIVIMGVQGTGKSTVGALLADALDVPFVDGDDLHPPANRAKMAGGTPLDDADRAPWLRDVGARLAAGDAPVVACSALTVAYRDLIRSEAPDAVFVHLVGDRDVLAARIAGRDHEYMPATLLDSQLATLEPLEAREDAVALSIAAAPEAIVVAAVAWLER